MIKYLCGGCLVAVLLAGAIFWGTQWSSSPSEHEGLSHNTGLRVVCTTSMITDLVKTIGGSDVQVCGLMGPGVDPHLYRACPGDVTNLAQADVIFFNGLDLEGKLGELLGHMRQKKTTIALAECLDASNWRTTDFQGMYDPHVWHDVALWAQLVVPVADVLARLDQANADRYHERATLYVVELQELDRYVRTRAAAVAQERRILVTAHDAFGYFGASYGFQVVGLQGISTDSEVGTCDVQRLAEFMAVHKVPALFVESSIPQRTIQAVQRAVSAKGWCARIGPELFSDALGDAQSGADTYVGMIRHNIDSIVEALSNSLTQEG